MTYDPLMRQFKGRNREPFVTPEPWATVRLSVEFSGVPDTYTSASSVAADGDLRATIDEMRDRLLNTFARDLATYLRRRDGIDAAASEGESGP